MDQGGTANTMQPSSGTYGDVKQLDDLKSDLNLPPVEQTAPGGPGMGDVNTPRGRMAEMPSDGAVPNVLMGPTENPNVPVNTPLGGPVQPQAQAATAAQRRFTQLIALSENPEVSEETKQWAQMVIDRLAGGNQ